MKKFVVLLSLLALAACNESGGTGSSCPIAFTAGYRELPTTQQPARGRAFLFQGFPGDQAGWDAPPSTWLADAFRPLGYDVMLLAAPAARPCLFAYDGASYQRTLIQYVRGVVGTPRAHQIIGGISYGGHHAMMALEGAPDLFTGWFAGLPVTKLNALTELSAVGEVKSLDPFAGVKILSSKPGLITWGTKDERVNYRLIVDLASRLDRSHVKSIEYVGLDHRTTDAQISDIAAWLNSLQ